MLKIILTRLGWALVQIQRLFPSFSYLVYDWTLLLNAILQKQHLKICVCGSWWGACFFWKEFFEKLKKDIFQKKVLLTFMWRYLFWYENACKWNFQTAEFLFLKKGSQTRWRTKKNPVLSLDLASSQGSVLIAICLQGSVSSFFKKKYIHLCGTWFTSQLGELPSKLPQPLKRISVSYSHALSFTFCVMCIYAYECMQIYANECICSNFL